MGNITWNESEKAWYINSHDKIKPGDRVEIEQPNHSWKSEIIGQEHSGIFHTQTGQALNHNMNVRRPNPANATSMKKSMHSSLGVIRLSIFLSAVWLITIWFIAWSRNSFGAFLLVGVLPIGLGWGLKWVLDGFSSHDQSSK